MRAQRLEAIKMLYLHFCLTQNLRMPLSKLQGCNLCGVQRLCALDGCPQLLHQVMLQHQHLRLAYCQKTSDARPCCQLSVCRTTSCELKTMPHVIRKDFCPVLLFYKCGVSHNSSSYLGSLPVGDLRGPSLHEVPFRL